MVLALAVVALGAMGGLGARPARADAGAHELLGELGTRAALLTVYRSQSPRGGWRITGEYLLLDTFDRRFLEGEGGTELGVTTLKEGNTPIMFGHSPMATLQGIWGDGVFEGTRYGPSGQLRERFKFSATFPSMANYSAAVQCTAREGETSAALAFVIKTGELRAGSLSWTSRDAASGHVCVLGGTAVRQVAHAGSLRFKIGARAARSTQGPDCTINVDNLGDAVRVSAAGCSAYCGAQARIEPIVVDGEDKCRLLRPVTR